MDDAKAVDFKETIKQVSGEGTIVPIKNSRDIVEKYGNDPYPNIVKTLVDEHFIILEGGATVENVAPTAVMKVLYDSIKQASEMLKVSNREIKHLKEVTYNTDNQLRTYYRKNLPVDPDKAKPGFETELLYAEQRFINAAERCAHLINSFSSDEVVEFKMAYANLEKIRSQFPDLYSKLNEQRNRIGKLEDK